MKFLIKEVNNGFCRILYKVKYDEGYGYLYYSLQQDFDSVSLYRCTLGPYFEPSHKVALKDEKSWKEFEIPLGHSFIEKAVRDFLVQKCEVIDELIST